MISGSWERFSKREKKELIRLRHETCKVVKNFKSIEIYKFETIDKCKQEIDSLNENFKQCFKGRTKSFLIIVVKDKILMVLFFIFLLICFLLIVI